MGHMTGYGKKTPLTVVRLAAFANWFKEAFPVAKLGSSGLEEMRLFEGGDIYRVLQQAILNYICLRPEHQVMVFVLAARAIGWNTRLVLNFSLVPQKPDKTSSDAAKTKKTEDSSDNDKPRPGTSKEDATLENENKAPKKSKKPENSENRNVPKNDKKPNKKVVPKNDKKPDKKVNKSDTTETKDVTKSSKSKQREKSS